MFQFDLRVGTGLSCLWLVSAIAFTGCDSAQSGASQNRSASKPPIAVSPRPELKLVVPEATEEISPSQMELVLIQPGKFLMGSVEDDSRSLPQEHPMHIVEIKEPFYLGKYEVTQEQYQSMIGRNPSWFSAEGAGRNEVKEMNTDNFPVESVGWYEALEYLNALSVMEGFPPYYALDEIERQVVPHENIETPREAISSAKVTIQGGPGYRLPTEEEWEYACRAGTDTAWSFGDTDTALDDYAITGYLKSGQRVHQKGEKKPNALGLFDLHGNVAELCASAFSEETYRTTEPTDESVPATHRVVRGGSWFSGPLLARCSARNGEPVGIPKNYVGFRVARTAKPSDSNSSSP